jgi:hypothetical protein
MVRARVRRSIRTIARVPLSAAISAPEESIAMPLRPGSLMPGGTALCSPDGDRKGRTPSFARQRYSMLEGGSLNSRQLSRCTQTGPSAHL